MTESLFAPAGLTPLGRAEWRFDQLVGRIFALEKNAVTMEVFIALFTEQQQRLEVLEQSNELLQGELDSLTGQLAELKEGAS